MWRVVQYLDHLAGHGSEQPDRRCREFAIRHAGKGVVVVISDFLDKRGYQEALRYLLARNMDIYVIHVLSHEEVDPELVGDLRLVDCEDDDDRRDHHQRTALEALQGQPERLRRRPEGMVHQRGITYIFTTNQYPFDKLILNYLAAARAGEVSSRGAVRS